jgi:hypothetical protein
MSQKLSELMTRILLSVSQGKDITQDVFKELLTLDLEAEPVFESLLDLKKGAVFHRYRNYLIEAARSFQFEYNKTKDPLMLLKMEAVLTTKTYGYKKKLEIARMYPGDVKIGASQLFLNKLLERSLGEQIPEDAPSGDTEVRPQGDIFKGMSDEQLKHIVACKQSDNVVLTSPPEECFDERGHFIGGRGYRSLNSFIGGFFQGHNIRLTRAFIIECQGKPWF